MKTLIITTLAALSITLGMRADNADDIEFQKFSAFLYQFDLLAPEYNLRIKNYDDAALQEYLWLYHFLEGHSPREAILDLKTRSE